MVVEGEEWLKDDDGRVVVDGEEWSKDDEGRVCKEVI